MRTFRSDTNKHTASALSQKTRADLSIQTPNYAFKLHCKYLQCNLNAPKPGLRNGRAMMKTKPGWKNLSLLAVTIFGACHARVCRAQERVIEPQARALLEQMAAHYKNVRSYSDVTTLRTTGETFSQERHDEFNFRAQVAWQKPNRARIVKTAAAGVSRSVSDGTTLRAVTTRYPGYYLQRAATDNGINDAMNEVDVGAPGLAHIQDAAGTDWMVEQGMTSLKMSVDAKVDGVPVHQIIALMEFPGGGSAVDTISIGARDGLLHRVTQEYYSTKGHSTIVETHSQIKLNPTLPPATFDFAVPANAKAIDFYSKLDGDEYQPKVKIGAPLPNFHATDLNDKPVALSDYRGQIVIVHFFASWEATSADVPDMVKIARKYRDQNLVIIGVAMDARRERVTELVQKQNVPYPVIYDGKGWQNAVAQQFGVRVLPTTLIVGRDGILRAIEGRPMYVDFQNSLAKVLADKTITKQ